MTLVVVHATFRRLLKSIIFVSFSNIKACLKILRTLPVTTCTDKQSFYFMRRLRTYTPNTMISEKLNGIGIMHVFQEIVPDIEKVVKKYYFFKLHQY